MVDRKGKGVKTAHKYRYFRGILLQEIHKIVKQIQKMVLGLFLIFFYIPLKVVSVREA